MKDHAQKMSDGAKRRYFAEEVRDRADNLRSLDTIIRLLSKCTNDNNREVFLAVKMALLSAVRR